MTAELVAIGMRSSPRITLAKSTDRITVILAVFWYSGTFSIRTTAGLRL